MTEKNTLISWLYDGALFVGIVGVFLLFVNYGLGLLYPQPEYEEFCDDRAVRPTQNLNKKQCEAIGGKWQQSSRSLPTRPTSTSTANSTGYCDRDFTCRQQFEQAKNTHDRIAFTILSLLGLLVGGFGLYHGAGSLLRVSLGTAGVLLVLISAVRFWDQADDWLQFGLLFVVLIVFISIGYNQE